MPGGDPTTRGEEAILFGEEGMNLFKKYTGITGRSQYERPEVAPVRHSILNRLFRESPEAYDLIITDQTMPKLTGMELIQEVRRLRPDLPLILCTGFSEGINGEVIRSLGLKKMLLKPIPTSEMARTVREALEGARLPASPPRGSL